MNLELTEEQKEIKDTQVIFVKWTMLLNNWPKAEQTKRGMKRVEGGLKCNLDHACHRTKHCSASQYSIPIAMLWFRLKGPTPHSFTTGTMMVSLIS